ncbi:hypothetical protein PJE062_388 [Pseudovibrio sp. JE062]|nr:hypothetical protein PJE062_388 [Pseudovibrio sp. JE062]
MSDDRISMRRIEDHWKQSTTRNGGAQRAQRGPPLYYR